MLLMQTFILMLKEYCYVVSCKSLNEFEFLSVIERLYLTEVLMITSKLCSL